MLLPSSTLILLYLDVLLAVILLPAFLCLGSILRTAVSKNCIVVRQLLGIVVARSVHVVAHVIGNNWEVISGVH